MRGDTGGGAVSNLVSNCIYGLFLANGQLMCEILSWLPVKSLVRFKCVCKTWKVLFEDDPYFIALHLARSETRPSLFISYKIRKEKPDWMVSQGYRNELPAFQTWLMTTNLLGDRGRADIHTIKEADSYLPWSSSNILGPLNGLICFIDTSCRSLSMYQNGVCLYNVSTREVTQWIWSNRINIHEKYVHYTSYRQSSHFGFDPNTMEHKVVCFMNLMPQETNTYYEVCWVLTVGDGTWRRIVEVPTSFEVLLGSLSVSGSLYWVACELIGDDEDDDFQHRRIYLMAFDVGSEKFREIEIPSFVLNNHCADNQQYFSRSDLLEVDGNVALARIQSDRTVNLWTFHDDSKNISNRTTPMDTSGKCWTELTITLPFPWVKNESLKFHCCGGQTGHIIFEIREQDPTTFDITVSYYSYNLKKKTLTNIDITRTPYSNRGTDDYPKMYMTFAESLLPVRKQIRSTTSGKLQRHIHQ